ncbi:unnamed protein product [Closterium sp. NIES-64]|nr:unnamed protein product [Closterium sp. NIES-64]
MDPSAGRDRAQESTVDSAGPRPQAPAAPRLRAPAHPSASEPVQRLERGLSLPHQASGRPNSPEYSWAPARVGSNRPVGQPPHERGRSPQRQPQQQRSPRRRSPGQRELRRHGAGDQLSPASPRSPRHRSPQDRAAQRSPRARSPAQRSPRRSPARRGMGSPGQRWDSGRREQSPPRPHSAGSGGRRGRRNGAGRGGAGRGQDPAVGEAVNVFAAAMRQARAIGEPTHVHIEVTNGHSHALAPDVAAPLRAPVLSEYLPARGGRALFRTPRQVPGFSAQPFSGGRLPGRETAYQREAPIAPPPTRAGRDPMLTMCRTLNLAEACEVVANLQMAVCGAMQNSPGSFAPGPRGSCATWAEALAPILAPVSEAPAGVAPLARTFPRHVEDLLVAAQEGTPDRIVDESGATAVVNLQSDLCFDALQIPIAAIREQAVQRGLRLERVPIRDFDHGDQAFMLPVAVRMVNLLIAEGCDVYIHCTAGINRATLTALGYLTFVKGMDLDSALSQIRNARPIAHPYLDCWHSVKGRLLAGREEEQMALATEIYEERIRSGGGGNASADWQQAQARVIQRTFDRYLQVDQGIIRSHKGVLQFAIKEQRAKHKEKRLANLAALASLSQEEERLAELQAQVRANAQTVKRTRWEALRLQLEAQRVEGQALLLQCARPDGDGAIVEKQLVE